MNAGAASVSSLELPDAMLTLLPWIGGVVVVVLGVLGALWLRHGASGGPAGPGGAAGADDLLVPPRDPARHGKLARFRARAATTGLGRRILVGLAVAVPLILAGVLLLRSDDTDTTPVFVEAPSRQPISPASSQSAAGASELSVPETPRPGARGVTGSEVAVDSQTGARMVLWAGDDQTGQPGRLLRRSLAVVLMDAEDRPIADREVRFDVAPGGGEVQSASVRTSGSGLAATTWRLGQNPNALSVRAYLADRPEVGVEFSAEFAPSAGSSAAAQGQPEAPAALSDDQALVPDTVPEVAGDPTDPDRTAAGDTASAEPPTRVVATAIRAAEWSAGGVHTCWVDGAGGITCRGATGGGSTMALEAVIWGIEAGVFHVCGIAAGAIGCWPVTGDRQQIAGEWLLPSGAEPAELAVGSEHVCARSEAGRVYCWGSDARGQLGNGPEGDRAAPQLLGGLEGVVQLVGGWFHTCALTAAGAAYCWGANGSGQLGVGSMADRDRPTAVDQPTAFSDLAAGSAHTCAVTPAGQAWCWGENRYGQLGAAGVTSAHRPNRVDTDLRFSSLVAGSVHTCGLTAGDRAWCWGRNVFGQLGDGSTDDSPIPIPVSGDHRYARLSAGGAHTCGRTTDGEFYCWGNNIQGQLADGTRENRLEPVNAIGGGGP